MKSDQRHELKTNELRKLGTKLQPWLEQNYTALTAALCAIVLVLAVAIFWYRSSFSADSVGWARIAAANSAEEFANIADDFPRSAVGAMARLKEAQRHLASGVQLMFSDRAAGQSDLSLAHDSFQAVLNHPAADDEMRQPALYGLGETFEAQAKLDDATRTFQELLDQYPDSFYRAMAEGRINALKSDRTKDFYAWFEKQNPKPPDLNAPKDGATGEGTPPFGGEGETAPPRPPGEDVIPESGEAETSPAEGTPPTEPTEGAPAETPTETPAEPAPTEPAPTEPATEQPSTPEQPAAPETGPETAPEGTPPASETPAPAQP